MLIFALAACTSPSQLPGPGRSTHSTPPEDSATDTGAPDTGAPDSGGATSPTLPEGFAALAALGARNIVLVHVDTLRADALPFYGNEHDTLPAVGALPWLVVDGVHAQTSWTIPSTVSVLTGLTDLRHGVTHMTASGQMNVPFVSGPTLAQHLRAEGYATAVLSGNNALPLLDGVFTGFDVVDPDYGAGATARLAGEVANLLPWIDSLPPGEPFFAFLQPMDAHGPYQPQPRHLGTWSDTVRPPFSVLVSEDEQLAEFQAAYDSADVSEQARLVAELRNVYDETILGVDDGLADLVDGLAERGLAADTLIVVAGDHGETLAEEVSYRGEVFFGHGSKVRQELIRVPFLIHHPDLRPERLACIAQNTDLLPTLLVAVGLAPPADIDGRPMQDGCRTYARASTYHSNQDEQELTELLVSDGSASLRWGCSMREAHRYDLEVDPTGVADIPADAFVPLEPLEAEMRNYLGEIRAAFGDLECHAPGAEPVEFSPPP